MNKKQVRKKMLEKRSSLSKKEIEQKSNLIADFLYDLDSYKNSNFIMTYINFRKEVITKNIINYSLKIGKNIGVPISIPETRELVVSQLKNFEEELELGLYNILTPKKEYVRKVEPHSIDLVLVPGVAFDRKGYRIGYGGGYYDRFFNKIKKDTIKIGLAFETQIIDKVPTNKYDIPVDYIITEKGLIDCSN